MDGLKTEHARIMAPVLLVWGAEDAVFPVAEARPMVAQFGNCKGFVTIPGAKLFAHDEKPEEVARVARDLLLDPERRRS